MLLKVAELSTTQIDCDFIGVIKVSYIISFF